MTTRTTLITGLALWAGVCLGMCPGSLAGTGADGAGGSGPHGAEMPLPAASVRVAAPLGAIGRMVQSAKAGDVLTVPAGVYREQLVIDRAVTLVAEGEVVIDGGGDGDIVSITAADVTLQGFVVRNTGISLDEENAGIRVMAPRVTLENNVLEDILFGIDLREAPDSRIIGNRIGGKSLNIARRGDGLRLWRSDRSLVEGNTIHDGRDAIVWYSTGVVVRDNQASECRYGLHLMFSDNVRITGNDFSRNSVGIYLMYSTAVEISGNRLIRNRGPSGYGIGLKEADRFSVTGNLIVGNRSGVYLDGSPFTHDVPGVFAGNTVAYNDVGFTFLPSAKGNEIVGNNFVDNLEQVAVSGRGSLVDNAFWKGDRGNFWSDYTGYDKDGDGVGDFVHESSTLFENLLEKEPSLRLFQFSPAQQAIEFVGRAIPAVRPEPKFTDEVPLMRPLSLESVEARPAGEGLMMAAGGVVLVGIAGGIVRAGLSAPRPGNAALRLAQGTGGHS